MDPETIPGRPRRLGRQRSDGGGCDPGTQGLGATRTASELGRIEHDKTKQLARNVACLVDDVSYH
jgi:hypothetical protein